MAETVTVGLVDAATIDNGRGETRILFKAESLRLPQDVAISSAVLTFPKSAEGLEGVEYLAIHPVAAAWSPGSVDWTLGWNRAGGDFVEDHYARAEAVLGSAGEVTFDVTSIIKEVEEEVTIPLHLVHSIRCSAPAA